MKCISGSLSIICDSSGNLSVICFKVILTEKALRSGEFFPRKPVLFSVSPDRHLEENNNIPQ